MITVLLLLIGAFALHGTPALRPAAVVTISFHARRAAFLAPVEASLATLDAIYGQRCRLAEPPPAGLTTAFVVELPPEPVRGRRAARYARAVTALLRG